MLTVHHLNNSRSQRVLWLLEELAVPYEIKHYQRDAKTMLAPPELRKVHPLGKSPVVTEGDVTVAETGAIIEYVVARYGQGRLVPKEGSADRLRYTYWLHYAEGSAMSPLLLKLVFDRVGSSPMPFFVKPVVHTIVKKVMDTFVWPQLKAHVDYLESEVVRFPWFAGTQFSAADIQMSFPIEVAKQRVGFDASTRPNLCAFLERIHQRPAYKRALERGGAYAFAQ